MDQNGGGGGGGGDGGGGVVGSMGNMESVFGMSSEELQQMEMDSSVMNMDMNLDLAMSPDYGNVIDPTAKEQQRQGQQQHFSGQKMNNFLMPGFGSGPPADLDGFQFDPSTSMPPGVNPSFVSSPAVSAGTPNSIPNGGIAKRRMDKAKAQRRASSGNIALNTDFGNLNSGMMSASQSPIHPMTAMGVPMNLEGYGFNGTGLSADMGMSMGQGADMSGMYGNAAIASAMPVNQPLAPPRRQSLPSAHPQRQQSANRVPTKSSTGQENGNGHMHSADEHMVLQKMNQANMNDPYIQAQMMNQMPTLHHSNSMGDLSMGNGTPGSSSAFVHHQPPISDQNAFMNYDTNQQRNMNTFSTGNTNMPGGPGGETLPGQHSIPQYLNAYSSTGFDMLTVLMKVATRPKPRINIGAVDLSCAFVVCDVAVHDVPIVYCSEMFERLTGYTKHEILGRNCRFLQAPDGVVESGRKRKYVDDRAVLHLKNMISQRQEAQISLINYRKGGQPFMNLLTMIPITWDTDEIRYYVGFQVDLVEQPGAVTNKNPDGTYQINYQRNELEPYQVPKNNVRSNDVELDRSIGSDEVSTVLANIGQNESEISRRIWDKVLLENTDDVVHVLSLKGLFLYLSPSCKRVLEYDPHELVGTALSSVCHPSDIVPVTRELKDTSSGANVNVVFRIRRKNSGYTWFEAHGTLHLEQGKAKKCIILVGRERPVYALLREQIVGGFGEQELWTKMSTTGMFLYVSHNVKQLLDRLPEDLVGTTAHNLMRPESRAVFGQALEVARTGTKHTFTHDVQNKRGQTLHAETTIYPGDAAEGKKPTFLVAQTRLIKMSRSQPSLLKQSSSTSERSHGFITSADSKSPHTTVTASSGTHNPTRPTPQSLMGQNTPSGANANANGVLTSAGGHGLLLGSQDETLAADDNFFDELKTTRSTSWQFELRQMEKRNRLLAEELQSLLSNKKKRKRRKGMGQLQKDCANCHTRNTPEWRRGPSGQRDLCNSCGLRWAKQQGRVSPRTSSQHSGDKHSSASSPRASISGDKIVGGAGSQGSPNPHQSPSMSHQQLQNGDRAVKSEPGNSGQGKQGMAGLGELAVPQTIQEGVEPAEDV